MVTKSLFFLILLTACGKQIQTGSNPVKTVSVSSSFDSIKVCGDILYKEKGFYILEEEHEYFLIGENQKVRDKLNSIQDEEKFACVYSNKFGNYESTDPNESGQTIYIEKLEFL